MKTIWLSGRRRNIKVKSALIFLAASVFLIVLGFTLRDSFALTVTSVTPNSGDTAGGTPVTIVGNDFAVQTEDYYLTSVQASNNFNCATASNGRAYCWGAGGNGRLGNGSAAASYIPTLIDMGGVLNGKTIASVATGSTHACALDSNNLAYCWGAGASGQLGTGNTSNSNIPVAVATSSGALAGLTVQKIAIGNGFTCAIASNGNAYCWGAGGAGRLGNNNTANQSLPVAVVANGALNGLGVTDISLGNAYGCAIASDGNAYCWGQNTNGQLGKDSAGNSNVPVAVSTTGVLAGKTIKSISAGFTHACAIASDDKVYCWGANGSGQLGDGTTTTTYAPVDVSDAALGGKTVVAISAGGSAADDSHTCAITSDSMLYCWGSNTNGWLGDGTTTAALTPTPVSTTGALANVEWASVTAGFNHTCAISVADITYCWGLNSNGQLGNNSTVDKYIPTDIYSPSAFASLTYKYITTGNIHTCAIASDDKPYCWGSAGGGRLGDNQTSTNRTFPVPTISGALGDLTVKIIAAGGNHTCAIASDDNAYCWGAGTNGQLGNGATTTQRTPVAVYTAGVLSGKTITSIASGNNFSCAIASDSKAYCWGQGAAGRLGNNSTVNSNVPVAVNTSGVLAGKNIAAITIGVSHACVLDSAGKAYCWGGGGGGRLGNNSTANSLVPVAVNTSGVLAGKTLTAIAAGNDFTCALDTAGQAYCWGTNSSGQLGDSSSVTSSLVPVAVDFTGALAGKTLTQISAGYQHICAVDASESVYCWGSNITGQLGNGTTNNSNIPVAVTAVGALSGESVLQVAAGGAANYSHTCVITVNGTTAVSSAHCWGANQAGQLGNGSTTNSSIPTDVGSIRVELPFTVSFDIEGTEAICEDVSIARNGKSITCTTTAHASGLVSVTINDGVNVVTLPDAYTYRSDANLTIANISPNFGLTDGDTEVTIYGTNFSAGLIVTFDIGGDAEECQNVTLVSLTELTCETPAHIAGLVSVTLDNGVAVATLDPLWIDPTDPHDEDNILSGFLYLDEPYISMSVSNSIDLGNLTPGANSFGTDSHTISVQTNVSRGYALYVSTDKTNSNLQGVTPSNIIGPVTGTISQPSGIQAGQWGFSLSAPDIGNPGVAQWVRAPAVNSPIILKNTNTSNETPSGDQTTIYYGARISTSNSPDSYQTRVVYTAIAN